MASLLNRARMTTTTTGTGTVTLGSAVTGHASLAEAGAVNGTMYPYCIEDGNDFEVGVGTYTTSGTTFSRDTVNISKISGTAGTTKISLSGSAQIFVTLRATDVREVLEGDRTYYVRSDGSDSNNGLANTSGGALATLNAAWTLVKRLDLKGFTVTIKIGNTATLTAGLLADGQVIGGTVILEGDTGTPGNTIISVASGTAVNVTGRADLLVKHVRLAAAAGSAIIAIGNAAKVTVSTGVEFGACAGVHVFSQNGAYINYTGSTTVIGDASNHVVSQGGGAYIEFGTSNTVTASGTRNFVDAFVSVSNGGGLQEFGVTFSGTFTGKRYDVTLNGVIQTFGGGASNFPGNAAGTSATGGQYG